MAGLLDARGFQLVPNVEQSLQGIENRAVSQQNREQSAELQPFRVQEAQQRGELAPVIQQQQEQNVQQTAFKLQQAEQQQQFLNQEFLPFVNSEGIISKLGKIDSIPDKKKFLQIEALKAFRNNDPILARNLNELSQESDEDLRLASTNFAQSKAQLIQEGAALGVPGIIKLLPKTSGSGSKFTRGASAFVQEGGKNFIVSQSFDKTTGNATLSKTEIPGKFLSRAGETPEQRKEREIATNFQKQLDTANAKTQQASDIKLGGEEIERFTERVNLGTEAAKQVPTFRRILSLLDKVETGGFDETTIREGLRLFGATGADAAELEFLFGKNVLSQLKNIFGSAFTEKEGGRLELIEASLKKSTAGNRRLINQQLKQSQLKIETAIEDLLLKGGIENIRQAKLLEQALTFEETAEPAQSASSIIEQRQADTPEPAPTRRVRSRGTRGGRQQGAPTTPQAETQQNLIDERDKLRRELGIRG